MVSKYDPSGTLIWQNTFISADLVTMGDIGADSYLVLFKRQTESRKRYMEGVYTLYKCNSKTNCSQIHQFEEGVLSATSNKERMHFLEFKFKDVIYPKEGGPLVPNFSSVNSYSNAENYLRSKITFSGIRSIKTHKGLLLLLKLFPAYQDIKTLGVMVYNEKTLRRVGGYIPFSAGEPYIGSLDAAHRLCSDFQYNSVSNNTYCIEDYADWSLKRTIYDIVSIDKNGKGIKQFKSIAFPYINRENKFIYVDEFGEIKMLN